MNITYTDEKLEISSTNAIENAYLEKFKGCSIEFAQINNRTTGGEQSFLIIEVKK